MKTECYDPPSYTLVLLQVGEHRLDVMRAVRIFRPALSLTEAKGLIDNAPSMLGDDVHHYDVHTVASLFRHTGATVSLTDNSWGSVQVFGPN